MKYRVTLTTEERDELRQLIQRGKNRWNRIRHAHILLALDEIPENGHWSDEQIARAYGSTQRSTGVLRKKFVEEGFAAALECKRRLVPPVIKIDGEKASRRPVYTATWLCPPDGVKYRYRNTDEKVFCLLSAGICGNPLSGGEKNRVGYGQSEHPYLVLIISR